MRIGIDVKELAKGKAGIAVYIRSMLDWFNEISPENQYFLFSNKDFEMQSNWTHSEKVLYKSKLTGSLGVCYEINKIIEKLNIDIFWGPEHCIPLKKGNFKTVVTIHDIAVIINPKWGTTYNAILQHWMLRKSLKCADSIIAISNSTKNDIIQRFKVNENKVSVIYNGDSPYNYNKRSFSEEASKQIKEKYNVNEQFFLYCGTIEPRKNIISIVEAFDLYKDKTNGTEKLVLCGGKGWKYEPILTAIESSKYCKDIIMTGFVSEEEKEFFYQNAIVFIFPSHYEGFGLPILEAMSCGTPVITANNSSLPEVGGKYAFYIEPSNNAELICQYMYYIKELKNDDLSEMKDNLINHAQMFSRKKCAEETIDIFKKFR